MSHPEATPRTDALVSEGPFVGPKHWVEAWDKAIDSHRQLERELVEAKNIIGLCHEAVGEAPESDDPSLPDCIKANISERSARIAELDVLLSQERAARLAAEKDGAAYRKRAISYVVHKAVDMETGLYPASVSGGKNAYEKRTDWMEGWNAAISDVCERRMKAWRWLSSLDASTKTIVENLLLSDSLSIHVNDETVSLSVNCNDLFFWGCSDAEEIELGELQTLSDCVSLCKHGGLLWCARKRKFRPQGAYYKYFTMDEVKLFDECGPERADGDGKAYRTEAIQSLAAREGK